MEGVCFDTFGKYTLLNHIYSYWERLKKNSAAYNHKRSTNKIVRAHNKHTTNGACNKKKDKKKKQEKKQKNKKGKKEKNIFL